MRTHEIVSGSKVVRITEQDGRFTSRLYVNGGETATLNVRKTTTMAGALKQANRMLAAYASFDRNGNDVLMTVPE